MITGRVNASLEAIVRYTASFVQERLFALQTVEVRAL
jgi:hypothetical protein